MKSSLLLLCYISFVAGYTGIGDALIRTFLAYTPMPINTTAAEQQGWVQYATDCNKNLGYPYVLSGTPDQYNPLIIYFTAGGQIAGLGVVHYDAPAPGLEDYWIPITVGSQYLMTASFRSTDNICTSGYQYEEIMGDRVVINQGSGDFVIPLTEDGAQENDYTSGSCLNKMGRHWGYDLKTHPELSWNVSNFQPVVPMYMNGTLSAFFFTTSTIQSGSPFGTWEFPLYFQLMCENFCSDSCDWTSSKFSTLHFFLHDPSLNFCASQCPSNSKNVISVV